MLRGMRRNVQNDFHDVESCGRSHAVTNGRNDWTQVMGWFDFLKVPEFFSRINRAVQLMTDRGTWIRVGTWVLGGTMILIGVLILFRKPLIEGGGKLGDAAVKAGKIAAMA